MSNGSDTLDGMTIAIAGAGGGLGGAVAERLAMEGASLSLADVDPARVRPLAESLVEQGVAPARLHYAGVDLLDASTTAAWRDEIATRFGKVDALLHLVGGWRGGDPIESFDLADYEFLHDLLVRTVQVSSRVFHRDLVASPRGRFAIVSSTQAQRPEGTNAAYAAAKAAAEAWTLALADSFATTNATANVIVVHAILTGAMLEADPDGDHSGLTRDTEIAAALAYLCGEDAAAMNGQRIELHR